MSLAKKRSASATKGDRAVKRRMKDFILRKYTQIYGLFHSVEKKILFSSFGGKQFSDNPRAIYEEMKKRYPDYQLVWQLKNDKDDYGVIPEDIQVIGNGKFDFYKALATSFCFVTNEALSPNYHKRKHQFFVNCWHGDRAIKKIGYDEYSKESGFFSFYDDKLADLCVAASEFGVKMWGSAFHCYDNVKKLGTPRNDKLVNLSDEERNEIRKRFPMIEDKRVVTYAPTFRDNIQSAQNANIDLVSLLNTLNRDNNEWVCFIRAHCMSQGICYPYDNIKFIDVSAYPDMADILCITDLLITDYSSSTTDYVITGKAAIQAVFDMEEYQSKCRGFYHPMEDVGFLVAHDQAELEKIVTEYTQDDYRRVDDKICEFYKTYEPGNASAMVAAEMVSFYEKNYDKKNKKHT